MEMHKNSLFSVLLRSPWWMSFAAAAGIFGLTRLALRDIPAYYAIFGALPFIVIGCVAGWKQLRAPSVARVAAALEALRGQSWEQFGAALEDAFKRDGYGVVRLNVAGAEFELTKAARVSLVGGKRWKVARAGVEPLRELQAARLAREAHECLYVAAGEITDNARAFAAQNGIRLLEGAALAELLSQSRKP
jgi:restriction system protein